MPPGHRGPPPVAPLVPPFPRQGPPPGGRKEKERKRKGKENAGKERRADHGGGRERSAGLTMVGPAERSVWPVLPIR